ncbi:antitoxin VapB1 [Sinorhizobium sp. KGO-5]|uniref:antitoxin n=1 Tax=Sinorhizobium sp. KGO-5 TaxID=1470810 RepID=UPI00294A88F6|nr:antitoxin VapB1 [Sinorhizobium sp. KGO-5]
MATKTAKIFASGRSQAVRLPAEFRFEGSEVFVRRDPKTGDVILSRKPDSWDGLFELYGKDQVGDDFLGRPTASSLRHRGGVALRSRQARLSEDAV